MKIYNFEQFIKEALSEGFPFHLSDVLVLILSKIDDPIAKELLNLNSAKQFVNYTIIDTEFNDDYVTFIPANYLKSTVYSSFDDDNELKRRFTLRPITPAADAWYKGRNPIKIGRLVNNLFPGKFSNSQVEVFVNKFKANNQRIPNHFEVYKSFQLAYDTDNYSKKYGESNQLWNSCMNDAGDILDFYSHNDAIVECLVLLEDELDIKTGEVKPKIIGRSLIWNTPLGLFMDRVYFIHDKDYHKFIDYAKENKIMYKSKNQSSPEIKIVKNGVEFWEPITLDIKYDVETYDLLPYLDTFWYAQKNKLMNYIPKDGGYYKLNGTEGDWESYINVN